MARQPEHRKQLALHPPRKQPRRERKLARELDAKFREYRRAHPTGGRKSFLPDEIEVITGASQDHWPRDPDRNLRRDARALAQQYSDDPARLRKALGQLDRSHERRRKGRSSSTEHVLAATEARALFAYWVTTYQFFEIMLRQRYGAPPELLANADAKVLVGLRQSPGLALAWACSELGRDHAVALFAGAPPLLVSYRAFRLSALLNLPRSPLYTIDELVDHLYAFAIYLKRNRDPLIRSGYPDTDFDRCPILNYLSSVYVVGPPGSVEHFPWLSHRDAQRIADSRHKVVDALIEVASTCADGLDEAGRAREIFQHGMQALRKHLTHQDLGFFEGMDAIYLAHRVRMRFIKAGGADFTTRWPGTLSAALVLIGYCEKEWHLGTFARLKDALGPIIARGSHRASYWTLVKELGAQPVDSIVDDFLGKERQEAVFWEDFANRVSVHKTKFPRAAPYGPFVIPAEWYEEYKECVATTTASFLAERRAGSPRPRQTSLFPSPPDLTWPEVRIAFPESDDGTVRFSVRDVSKTYHFADLGLRDGRRGGQPATAWSVLRGCAELEGRLFWGEGAEELLSLKSATTKRDKEQGSSAIATKRVSELRVLLKKVFGVTEDPFERYVKGKGWQTKFRVFIRHGN